MNDAERVYDRQRQKVYKWENATVAPLDQTPVPFNQIKAIVHHVWKSENLQFPPQIKPLSKNCKKAAQATRLALEFPEITKTWIILHETAHAMTSIHTGESNHHGALFMGVYLKLIAKYLNQDFKSLVASAQQAGIVVKEDATPVL